MHNLEFNKTVEVWTVEQWIEMDDNPIQRNTEDRAVRASRKHLQKSSVTHSTVFAASCAENGRTYKLDGHTRAYLWRTGKLAPPENLHVVIHHVDKLEDVINLYKQFDNKDAAESATDRLHGAYRYFGLSAKSGLVRMGGINSAISFITKTRGFQYDPLVHAEKFIPALELIDEVGFSKAQFSTPFIAALLLSVLADGQEAIGFWKRYANDEGIKDERGRDGVQAAVELRHKARAEGRSSYAAEIRAITEQLLTAYGAFKKGHYVKRHLNRTAVENYIKNNNIVVMPEKTNDNKN
ncbi:hypothetical protein [Marinobacterium litorale]|uniref:hypothetical protein n=1 Tax=Marinobacterium litorale TaxID=404770 RepID=UPI00041AE907|nr:hypothetical protein [Marinobacterium litorale]